MSAARLFIYGKLFMKIKLTAIAAILLLWLVVGVQQVYACGACGCALNNYNPELLVNSGNNSIGLMNTLKMYSIRTIADAHTSDGAAGTHLHYRQVMSQHDLRGVYYPHPKVFIMASLPLNHISFFVNDMKKENLTGLGDGLLMAGYQVAKEHKQFKSGDYKQRLILNGGVKVPTGAWRKLDADSTWNPDRQMGTGSVDFIVGATYFFKRKSFGFNLDGSYKINTANRKQFRFGNTFNADLSGFYLKQVRRVTMVPNVGMQMETSATSTWYGRKYFEPSGGTIMLASAGMDLYYRNFGFNIEYFHPLVNRLNGVQMESKVRLQVGLRYIISKKSKN
jgi:hypothetical protein